MLSLHLFTRNKLLLSDAGHAGLLIFSTKSVALATQISPSTLISQSNLTLLPVTDQTLSELDH